MNFRNLLLLIVLLLGVFQLPGNAAPALGKGVTLQTRDPVANKLLNQALAPAFWTGADKSEFGDKQLYDEIWLKWVEGQDEGYMMLITGEGREDFDHTVVADIIIGKQHFIPRYIEGAKAITTLGKGTDPRNGAPYVDTFYYLDMELFYAVYTQRMYRLSTGDGRTILYFEKIDESFTGPEVWAGYQAKIDQTMANVKRRSIGGSIIPVKQIFGMFIVSDGADHKTRVTFITKMAFSSENWVASMGSKLKPVIKAGLDSGFNASVSIARDEQVKRGVTPAGSGVGP